jgi:hypothetical protein
MDTSIYRPREEILSRWLKPKAKDAEGANLENRRNQTKLSGKRTPSRISLESLIRDADGANPLYKG